MSLTVAYLGPAGTFTEAALHQFELGEVAGIPVSSPGEALDLVRSGKADRAVVAVENSVDGAVTATFDALVAGKRVQIYQETSLEVAFAIMSAPGMTGPQTITTHPVAYQQIRKWVEHNLPGVSFMPATSNAAAAQMVAEGKADLAAAPAHAAEIYGLDILHNQVADVAGATTRFILVGPPGKPTPRTGSDVTSVVFTLPNEPGTLVDSLQEFAYRGVDMARIESRPTRTEMGTYRFYVDIDGHLDDPPVAEALRALYLRAKELIFVGSWPVEGRTTRHDEQKLRAANTWVARMREGQ
ncbi:prephenate dehydratase [Corynebacterium phocae]|uniref:Prephenate dehydratase n=1 Tax=Corynebacterium phocae TaxID=161895 RepID=A0A1L7D5J2_9CORY|nr:prephenate dehydratase [Corynebacterium phocae]APT93436.1 prephenate dehydratase [Corynebacterium phocae]KAA8721130.1 prephenate dehydratase [Corynebacterium phocae]